MNILVSELKIHRVAKMQHFILFLFTECICGQQDRIDNILKQNQQLKVANQRLRAKYLNITSRCMSLTDALSAKVIGKPHQSVFTDISGFTNQELSKFSDAAH